MKTRPDLVIRNIGQLLTMDPESGGYGDELADPVAGLGLVLDGAVAIQGGRVVWSGKEQELADAVEVGPQTEVIDAGGRVVLPGLVECHTHLVFAGSRAHEFARRISGATYEEILATGGGIHATVRTTREATEDALVALAMKRLDTFLAWGVTTVEVKSGYGLQTEDEIKMLRVVAELNQQHDIDLVGTFLGAHTLPLEHRSRREAYVDAVIEEMIPRVAEEGLARFCDVFCEQGAFTLEEARRILVAGMDAGLRPKLHAEQLTRTGSVDLAVKLDAASVDHLELANREDAERLAGTDTVAVLLPGATYFLAKTDFAPGRMLADAGCAVAVSTDFNPGSCMSENLPLMANMACLYCGLYPREALMGVTRWAAKALGLEREAGCLVPGVRADLLVLDTRDYRNFVYHFGVNHTHMLFKRGRRVV